MKFEKFFYNDYDELCANTYVVSDDNGDCVIFDPSKDNESVVSYLKKNSLTPKAILLTHGHFDHIKGVDAILKEYDVPIYIHADDAPLLTSIKLNCSFFQNPPVKVEKEPILLSDGEILNLLKDEQIKVIHTPFHTEGSVCYYFINNKVLISGDTLFYMSIGRDDLPTGDHRKIRPSLEKLKSLPKETKVYPGHGQNSSMEFELKFNHFLTN